MAGPLTPDVGGYDELRDAGGMTRPHWQLLESSVLAADTPTLTRTQERVRRLRRHQGTTPAAPARPDRMGALDPIPHVVAGTDWMAVESGLEQRARLLDALLGDLYGPQRLITSGVVPATVVYAYPGFLRPCAGTAPPRWLVVAACDLVRGPDGRFLVRADRAGVPEGLGEMLSARRVLAQIHPDQYRALGVARVDSFYDTLRSTLAGLAREGTDNPRTAILTPGPGAESFPEHAYLARTLGLTLVVGSDLTVRHGRVFVMSVAGLEPVDVVLRLVEDRWCDPLELRSDSSFGPPGLVEASRRGTVRLANALGVGLVENPGLAPFLTRACRSLLGEKLALEGVPAHWCGEPKTRRHVLARLDRMVLRTVDSAETFVGHRLDATRRETLAARIEARPDVWVGYEEVEASTTPLVHDGAVAPGRLGLRGFVVADGDGWCVLPAGLARAVLDGGGQPAGVPLAVRKDAWVLAEDRHPLSTPALTLGQVDLATSLPSRNAEALYWIGRHAETAETAIRLVQTIAWELDETPELATEAGGAWVALYRRCLAWTGEHPKMAVAAGTEVFAVPDSGALDTGAIDDVLRQVLVDDALGSSLVSSLSELLAASLSGRELLSTHTCQVLVALEDQLGMLRRTRGLAEAQETAASTLTHLMALVGLSAESMVRDPGWLFTDIGRRLERARLLLRMLRETLVDDVDPEIRGLVYETLLACCESLVAFRRRYRSDVEVSALAQFLFSDAGNPRSLRYQLDQLHWDLERLPGESAGTAVDAVGAALGLVLQAEVGLLAVQDGRRDRLAGWLAEVAGHLDQAADAVLLTYFAHVPVYSLSLARLGETPRPALVTRTAQ
ncbi:MAG: circularly permuted type 2 ATP-grasp protein [Acidimicrobiia bacterium]